MRLRVARIPEELDWPRRGTAVVIDVLRATTVITRALQAGAAEVFVCGEIEEALDLASRLEPRPLLAGERNCEPIAGFDLGNSPREYESAMVAGKSLVMTTTNGTRAVLAADGFPRILAASFNNLAAVCRHLEGQTEVSIICAGTDGAPTEEDTLLAGAILAALPAGEGRPVSPGPGTPEREAWDLFFGHLSSGLTLAERFKQTRGGRNLVAAGYDDDLQECARVDSTTTIGVIDPDGPMRFRHITP